MLSAQYTESRGINEKTSLPIDAVHSSCATHPYMLYEIDGKMPTQHERQKELGIKLNPTQIQLKYMYV